MVPDWKTNGKTRTQADSFRDAARGFFHTVKTERNMRIHLTAAVYVLFFSPFLGVTRSEYGVLLLTIAMVIAAEAFNTAMEMLCDYAQKSYNPLIGKTKDIAAGAVLVCCRFCRFCRYSRFMASRSDLSAFDNNRHKSALPCAFHSVAHFAFFFIFKVPCGVREKLHKK